MERREDSRKGGKRDGERDKRIDKETVCVSIERRTNIPLDCMTPVCQPERLSTLLSVLSASYFQGYQMQPLNSLN